MQYILFDLEATCWENPDMRRQQEIIEIGAVKLDEYRQVTDTFETFVRPELHPRLSRFCTQLTGISQEQVDDAPKFKQVMERFLSWSDAAFSETLLVAWGDFDQRVLRENLRLFDMDEEWTNHYLNLKKQYKRFLNNGKPVGLKKAVEREGMMFEGAHHRALSDAGNMYKLFYKHFDYWEID